VGQEGWFPAGSGSSLCREVALVVHLTALGLADQRGCGQACRQRWPQAPLTAPCALGAATASARPQDTGPEPADAARTTVSPLSLVAMHPEAVAVFPTPTGRMWDFPGCEAEDG